MDGNKQICESDAIRDQNNLVFGFESSRKERSMIVRRDDIWYMVNADSMTVTMHFTSLEGVFGSLRTQGTIKAFHNAKELRTWVDSPK